MKKLLFILVFILMPFVASAQTCPFGLENDPAPGNCSRFIDENVNNLCDLSEVPLETLTTEKMFSSDSNDAPEYISGEELKKHTVSEVAEMYGVDSRVYAQRISDFLREKVNEGDSLQMLHDTYNLCAGVAGGIALNLKNETKELLETKTNVTPIEKRGKNLYSLVLITLTLLVLYLFTYILVKENKITLLTHQRIWNVLLLISFLISAILGVLLVIRINYGWTLNLPFNMLYWHVEAGIVMAVITMFHIAWHWRYFTIMFKRKNKSNDKQ